MARDNSLIWIVLIVAATVASWYFTGEMKESEFLERLATAQHKTDTVRTVKYLPQPRRDSSTHARPAVITHADSARIDSAFSRAWNGGKDSTRAFIERVTARASTSLQFDSVGTVDVEYDPIDRMFTIGLEPSPTREIDTKITDFVTVPLFQPDSFATRSAIFLAGAATASLIYAIAHK